MHGTALHVAGKQRTPIARSCTDLLVKPRCTDLHGKRASGFRISRICTVQHGRSLFIWILIWHCLWSSIQHDAAHGKHRAPIARICTELLKYTDARIYTENMQQDPQMHGIAWIPCSCLVIFTRMHVTARQFPDIYRRRTKYLGLTPK